MEDGRRLEGVVGCFCGLLLLRLEEGPCSGLETRENFGSGARGGAEDEQTVQRKLKGELARGCRRRNKSVSITDGGEEDDAEP